MRVEIIPCLQDNFSYLIIDESNNTACIVDPGEAAPIINFLKNKSLLYKLSQKFCILLKLNNVLIFNLFLLLEKYLME